MRPPTLNMISEVSGNVYWENKRFPACRRHFFNGREGGKGRRRLPVPTLGVTKTLTKHYVSVFFFSKRDDSSDRFQHYISCDEYIEKGDGEKSRIRISAGGSRTGHADYQMIVSDNSGASSFRVYPFVIHLSLHKHNTRALIRCLLPRLLQARRAGSLLACFRMRLLSLCVRNDERNCLHCLTSVSNNNYRNWYNFLAYKKENRRKNDMVRKDRVILGIDELMIKHAFKNSRFS